MNSNSNTSFSGNLTSTKLINSAGDHVNGSSETGDSSVVASPRRGITRDSPTNAAAGEARYMKRHGKVVIKTTETAEIETALLDIENKVTQLECVPQRFDVLKALITNSQSSTMRGILLDQVRNNMSTSSLQATDCEAHVTEIVELVLKPPHGGPLLFPDQNDETMNSKVEIGD